MLHVGDGFLESFEFKGTCSGLYLFVCFLPMVFTLFCTKIVYSILNSVQNLAIYLVLKTFYVLFCLAFLLQMGYRFVRYSYYCFLKTSTNITFIFTEHILNSYFYWSVIAFNMANDT